jgi:hypothetical protein
MNFSETSDCNLSEGFLESIDLSATLGKVDYDFSTSGDCNFDGSISYVDNTFLNMN